MIDYHRFLLTYITCIDEAPLQSHHSALALAPIMSLVKQTYGSGFDNSVLISRGAATDWGSCLDVFQGHSGIQVLCVAFSPDGTCFATGGEDDRIAIWRSTARTLLLSISGHQDDVGAVVFSPDGSHIVSGSSDKTVGLWRVTSGDCVYLLEGHTDEVWAVSYSGDGRRILSASNKEVLLWDAADGHCVLALSATNTNIYQAALSPDAGVIAYRGNSSLYLYHVTSATGSTITLPGSAHAATFSPDGRCIAAATETSIWIWTAANLAVVRSIDTPSFPLRLAFSYDGTRIACGLKDGSVCVWQVDSEDAPHVFQGHTGWVYDVAWSPDGAQIASVSDDCDVRVWESARVSSGDIRQYSHQYLPSSDSPPSTLLCQSDTASIIRIPTTLNIEQLRTPDNAPSLSLHLGISEAWDAVFSGALPVPEFDMGQCLRSRDWALLTGRQQIQTNWIPVTFLPDFSQMAYQPTGVKDKVHICDLRTGVVVAKLIGHTQRVRSACYSSDGALIVTGSADRTVKIWNVASAALVTGHEEHINWVYDTAFSSDDRLVVSGSADRTARVYDIAAARVIFVLQHHKIVTKVAFSADDENVLTLDYLRNVSIWDLSQAACVYRVSLSGNTFPQSLDFTPDGASILVRDRNGQVRATFAIYRPSERTWPAYHVSNDGWITAISPDRASRVCWLLPEWRAVFSLGGPRFCALDLERKFSVVLDVSRTAAYAETWGNL